MYASWIYIFGTLTSIVFCRLRFLFEVRRRAKIRNQKSSFWKNSFRIELRPALIWVHTVWKGYQQTILVNKELTKAFGFGNVNFYSTQVDEIYQNIESAFQCSNIVFYRFTFTCSSIYGIKASEPLNFFIIVIREL